MHLGINAIRLTRNFTGVGRYIECVLKEWNEMDVPFDRITLFSSEPLDQNRLVFPLQRYCQEVIGHSCPDPVWERRYLRTNTRDIDVLFCPSYTVPIGYEGPCAVTYLGPAENRLGSYHWWRALAYDRLYRYSARHARRVFACSHAVKERVHKDFGVPEEKIQVTYLAPSDAFRPIDDKRVLQDICAQYAVPQRPFILFVGKLARRHYIPSLLKAFAQFKSECNLPHQLVVAGPDYLGLNLPRRARRLGIADSVTYIPFVKHRDLPPLYSAAEFFIFPASQAEGFGIPVVEAMACGTPVVTVNQGSLKEIAPGAAVTVESSSVPHLLSGIKTMATDRQLRVELAQKGLVRAKKFTWRFTAQRTMETLWEVAQS